MITAQAKHSFPIITLKFCYQVNTAGRIGTTIDQVAQKYQHVGSLFAWKHFEQAMKLGATAMDIADDKSFHAGVSSRCCSDVLTLCIISLKRGSLCRSDQFGSDSNQR